MDGRTCVHTFVRTYRTENGSTDEHGWMDGWTDGRTDVRTYICTYLPDGGRIDGRTRTDGRMDGRTGVHTFIRTYRTEDGWTDERANGWTDGLTDGRKRNDGQMLAANRQEDGHPEGQMKRRTTCVRLIMPPGFTGFDPSPGNSIIDKPSIVI